MDKTIRNNISGILQLLPIETNNNYDTFFSMSENIVTILPFTDESKKEAHCLSYTDGSNEKNHWLFGITEDGRSIAFLKKNRLSNFLSSPITLNASCFHTPLIVKSTTPDFLDLRTFNIIEFRGGIVDLLHSPNLAIDEFSDRSSIQFMEYSTFTKSFDIELAKEKFKITYSIDLSELKIETGKLPDLRNNIHSILRFEFDEDKPLDKIEMYYRFALSFFQFCSGALNVNFDTRLYQTRRSNDNRIVRSSPILVDLVDGFDDYANEKLNFTQVIRFRFLGDQLPQLFQLLNIEKTRPNTNFFPKRNKDSGKILYTDVADICAAFEMEYSFSNVTSDISLKKQAENLTKELMCIIDAKSDINDMVKSKAKNILSSQLKGFSPSLKEKINAIYMEFEEVIRQITQKPEHIELGICKIYTLEEFKSKISDFVAIRNKGAHSSIVWNKSTEIYMHLNLLIYFSILKRAGFEKNKSAEMLSWLFGRFF